jgi:NADH dehydrogenase
VGAGAIEKRENTVGVDATLLEDVRPLAFHDVGAMAEALAGVEVLYNTYWVRLDRPPHSRVGGAFDEAVENSRRLFAAARRAGVRRIVHLSVTNPDAESRLGYFRGKARVEAALLGCGVPCAILRPALIFDRRDILLNNIAWVLRRLPVFGIPGDGAYRIQPILRDDLAKLAVRYGTDCGTAAPGCDSDASSSVSPCLRGDISSDSRPVIIDAIGPETFTYRELVETMGRAIGVRRKLISVSPGIALTFCRIVDLFTEDVMLVKEEIDGLMENRLWTGSEPVAETRFSEWVGENAAWLGAKYASDFKRRRFDRQPMNKIE